MLTKALAEAPIILVPESPFGGSIGSDQEPVGLVGELSHPQTDQHRIVQRSASHDSGKDSFVSREDYRLESNMYEHTYVSL